MPTSLDSTLCERGALQGTSITVLNFEKAMLSRADALAWVSAHGAALEAEIDRAGGVLLRGLTALRDASDFDETISLVAPHQRDYVGGTSPRTVVRRRIMTATDTPPAWSIALHQEMAYTRTPPDRIAFFCERPAAAGGQTTVGDMAQVLTKIPQAFRQRCEAHGVQLRRTIPSMASAHLKPGFQKDWVETFGSADRRQVERVVAQRGWHCSWLEDGESLQVWQDVVPPATALRGHDVQAWRNFVHFFSPICMMAWALEDGRVDDYEALSQARTNAPHMLDAMFYGNGEPIAETDCLQVFSLLRRSEVAVDMLPGDLMILDNVRYAHGRRAFEGPRSVFVALYDVPVTPRQ